MSSPPSSGAGSPRCRCRRSQAQPARAAGSLTPARGSSRRTLSASARSCCAVGATRRRASCWWCRVRSWPTALSILARCCPKRKICAKSVVALQFSRHNRPQSLAVLGYPANGSPSSSAGAAASRYSLLGVKPNSRHDASNCAPAVSAALSAGFLRGQPVCGLSTVTPSARICRIAVMYVCHVWQCCNSAA